MIGSVTGWFKIMQHNYKREISITSLVETSWLAKSSRSMEITNDQGS